MEELKVLIGMVADLPQLAIWVLVFFFIYKVVIVGSVFGVLKLGIIKVHDALTWRRQNPVIKQKINLVGELGDFTCGCCDELIEEIKRVYHRPGRDSDLKYLHRSDIGWLKDAIMAKIDNENADNAKLGAKND